VEEGVVTFARAWVLVFLLVPAALVAWQWTRAPRRLNLLLKAAMLVAVILALAEPELTISENKVSTIVLVDTSAGLSPEDLSRASGLVAKMDSARGRNWMRVIPFARGTRAVAAEEHNGGWQFRRTGGEAGRATDIEAAIPMGWRPCRVGWCLGSRWSLTEMKTRAAWRALPGWHVI